ncbi:hypothetical protein ZWY2020_010062 [Hordeum vulgare]|nr:hypothetical protein ZWY2020_010062 [Hordeum vulgare]
MPTVRPISHDHHHVAPSPSSPVILHRLPDQPFPRTAVPLPSHLSCRSSLDANIVRWGLHHLLDGDACVHRPQSPTTDYAPPPQQPHHASALLDAPALAEVRVDAVDNDEVIAHALQEELVQVAMAEASKTAGGEPDRSGTVLAQHWFRPEVVTHLPSGFSSGNTGMLAMVAVQIPMTALGVLLMDKAGRRPLLMDFTEKLQHLPQSKMLDLFQKDYIHAVTVGVGLMVLQQIPMTALGVLPMDKAGRRPLLMGTSLLQMESRRAMEMQAAAERKKRAQILESEGSFY